MLQDLFRANLQVTDWALRGAVALVFLLLGIDKLTTSNWVDLFAAIGLGQWFRYFTGMLQVAGALLLVIPGTARFGTALLASTMLGAVFCHLFVLKTGVFAALIPAFLLSMIVAAGWKGRGSPQPAEGFLSLR